LPPPRLLGGPAACFNYRDFGPLGLENRALACSPRFRGYGRRQLNVCLQTPECAADAPLIRMRELVDQPQIQGFERRVPRLDPLLATADREPRIDLVPTVRDALEELAIVGIIATSFRDNTLER